MEPRDSVDKVLRELEERRASFTSFCEKARDHIEECLRDHGIPFQSVQWRVKSTDKVRSKYSNPSKEARYKCLDDLTDIPGLRVITYYQDDIDRIKEVIEQEFAIDTANSADKRLPDNPETFTYHALHLIVSFKPETLGKRAHKQFAGIRGEVQITSILRHAWAEIEHRWYDLRDSFPPPVKRRFARLSALIDLADEEFVELREEWQQVKASIDRQVRSEVEAMPLDEQSFRAFIAQDPLVRQIDTKIAAISQDKIEDAPDDYSTMLLLKLSGINTIDEVRDKLASKQEQILAYCEELARTRNSFSAAAQPALPQGVCIFQLGMISFITKFLDNHSNDSEEVVLHDLRKSLADIGLGSLDRTSKIVQLVKALRK